MTQNKRSTRYFSKQQEKAVAGLVWGKPTANSGATPYAKGDVKAKDWLIECKTCMTPKKSFAIKKEWLTTIHAEAIQSGKTHYALAYNYGPKQENYYILDEKTFKALFDED